MKYVKLTLLAFGAWLLWATFRSVDATELAACFSASSPLFLIAALTAYPAIYAFNGLGWKHSFPKGLPPQVPFTDFWVIRVIGETLNAVVPFTGSLGGEPVKAHLLKTRHGVPLSLSFASLLIVHVTLFVSLASYVLTALFLTQWTRPIGGKLFWGTAGFLGVMALGAGVLCAGLFWGLFERFESFGKRFGWTFRSMPALDDDVRAYFLKDRRDFWLSSFFNFVALLFGVIEVYYFAAAVGSPVTWIEALVIDALIQSIRIATFFIPGSLGAQEGGIVFIFTELGLPAPAGFAFAVLRRLREAAWLALGLVLYALWRDKPIPAN